MKKEYILFIDSGVGGLSTLAETIKLVQANVLYFADNLHAPYGEHQDSEIFEWLRTIICRLTKQFNIKLVVLACNTATTSSIENLRKQFKNLTFIGTEPAIKLASDHGAKNAICLATPTTAKQKRFNSLKNMANGRLRTLAIPSLAMNIEDYLTQNSLNNSTKLLKQIHYISSKCLRHDAVILGCTHYCFIKKQLKDSLNLPIYDGNFGVAKQILKYAPQSSKKTVIKFIFSKKEKGLTQKYRKIFNQILAN